MAEKEKAQVSTQKRQKIQDSSRTMFIWVAGMSAVVGFCGVVAWFVFQQAAFKIKVVNEKNTTVKTLRANNTAVSTLEDNIRVLETNGPLRVSRANEDQNAVQVILDALPADANSLALGGSLQERLIKGVPNLTLESLSVDPTSTSLVSGETASNTPTDGTSTSENKITFKLVVNSPDPNALKEMLSRFERSIRVIDIDNLTLDRTEKLYTLTLQAHAYYEPARVIELHEKVVKP